MKYTDRERGLLVTMAWAEDKLGALERVVMDDVPRVDAELVLSTLRAIQAALDVDENPRLRELMEE